MIAIDREITKIKIFDALKIIFDIIFTRNSNDSTIGMAKVLMLVMSRYVKWDFGE